MAGPLQIGVVGDRDESITAHRALPLALDLAARSIDRPIEHVWLATDGIASAGHLARFDALWCAPGSPYRNADGALLAIGHAREQRVPFLGTCGGFQHAVIEFARHVLGWDDADHAETAPDDGRRLVISPLTCSLVEASETLAAAPGSRLAQAYGAASFSEGYRCRYGLNPAFVDALVADGSLAVAATGHGGDVRALEATPSAHPFFMLTLFQPEHAALTGRAPPLVVAFARAAAARAAAGGR
jgi:CTP synthase (UTP-ammonia lyase)